MYKMIMLSLKELRLIEKTSNINGMKVWIINNN